MVKCARCDLPTVGKSKYCEEHRVIAYKKWKAMIGQQASEKKERYADFELWYDEAHKAGMEAGSDIVPVPMVVVQHENMLDGNSRIVKEYEPVMDGVCGFAWVTVRPATCSFARWVKKNWGWRAAYRGGIQLWVGQFNQSYTRKMAYASAFANVLCSHDVPATSGGRLD